MTAYVALLRAINVGGRKLVMKDLAAIGGRLGFTGSRTFIASGNLLFTSAEDEETVKKKLERALREHMGADVPVMVRTAQEMDAVAKANPFSDKPGNRVVAMFLDDPPPRDALASATGVRDEQMELGKREIYIFYGDGMADSKLRIPATASGTARNMNTVAKLAELAREME
jgi:uncharacterized protein (DUF1697 family)